MLHKPHKEIELIINSSVVNSIRLLSSISLFSLMAFNGEIFEIFSRLQAKDLHRFKAVCKSCAEFPSERYFAMKQSQHLRSKDASAFFVQPDYGWGHNGDVEFLCMHGEESSCGFPATSLRFLKDTARVIASSNGLLICINNRTNDKLEIFVCNPVTQTWQPIPGHKIFEDANNVGVEIYFDDDCDQLKFPDDYKLIILKPDSSDWKTILNCHIYYPQEGRWKEIKIETKASRDLCLESPVYCKGLLYLISDSFPYYTRDSPWYRPYIVCKDIEKGTVRILQIPKDSRKGLHYQSDYDLRIFRWGKMSSSFQSICLVRLTRKSVFTVWVLKDSRTCSWRRILKRRVGALVLGINKSDAIVAGFTVINGDSLLFATRDKVYRYDLMNSDRLEAEEIGEHHQHGMNVFFTAYANSLHPCGSGVTFPM